MAKRIGTITLFFDPEDFKEQMDDGSRLNKAVLEDIAETVDEEVGDSFIGYIGYDSKFINVDEIEVINS